MMMVMFWDGKNVFDQINDYYGKLVDGNLGAWRRKNIIQSMSHSVNYRVGQKKSRVLYSKTILHSLNKSSHFSQSDTVSLSEQNQRFQLLYSSNQLWTCVSCVSMMRDFHDR